MSQGARAACVSHGARGSSEGHPCLLQNRLGLGLLGCHHGALVTPTTAEPEGEHEGCSGRARGTI